MALKFDLWNGNLKMCPKNMTEIQKYTTNMSVLFAKYEYISYLFEYLTESNKYTNGELFTGSLTWRDEMQSEREWIEEGIPLLGDIYEPVTRRESEPNG